jgi:N-acetylmuramoyl-L-alanine amidase
MLSPNYSGILKDPKFIVVHYSASGTFAGTRNWLCDKKSKVSAHYLIGRAGELALLVPLNRCAWHCGDSAYKGLKQINRYSIGIELVSWGPLTLLDGKFFPATVKGPEVPQDQVHDGSPPEGGYRYWQTYTSPQLQMLRDTIKSLQIQYPSITEVIGHRDVAPKRKQDPWPLDATKL